MWVTGGVPPVTGQLCPQDGRQRCGPPGPQEAEEAAEAAQSPPLQNYSVLHGLVGPACIFLRQSIAITQLVRAARGRSFFPGGTSRAPRVKATPWRCLVAPPFPCPRLKSWHTDPTGSPAATSPPAPGGVLGWGPSLQPTFSCQDRELRPEEIEGKAWGRCPQLESPLSPTRHPFPSAHPTLWPGGVAEGGCPPVPPASLRCPQS